jgi:aspartyl-tRNA(Asn)/glutamyl-tRNA(Gln) amidotransferase subunit A
MSGENVSRVRPSRRRFLAAGLGTAAWRAVRPGFAQTAQPADLTGLTLKKASELIRSKDASPVELTRACLARIEHYNPAVNAFITVTAEPALQQAAAMEAEIAAGKWRGPLHGVPIAIKDNIDTAGIRTTAASEVLKDRVPAEDAEVVRRLKHAGAILLGKLNLHEFALGGTSAVSAFGPVHNPWALDRIPGGSSGGSAAALAADLCFGALGTDTAGSVRIPAAHCSIVGFKPTYGRVSMRGVIPLSWTLDHVGPMAKTVQDAALLLNAIAGYDELDPTTVDVPLPDYSRAVNIMTTKLRVGVPRDVFFDDLDREVAKAVQDALEVLRKLTASMGEIALPPWGPPGSVSDAEVYGYHAKWFAESPEKYQPATRATIQQSSNAKAPNYAVALREINQARREIRKTFANVDVIVTPTMQMPPAPIADPKQGWIRNTYPFDFFGIPTISIPCGFTLSGLPIGLQIAGAPWAESTVLALAHAYEQATEWHRRRPPLPA